MPTVTTDTMPFEGGSTWLQVTTPDSPREGALPLIVLHGGPGMAHDYVRNIAALADETGRTVVHYDQFGCGRSTHRPDAPAEFWSPDLFVAEFEQLVEHLGFDAYHLLGQSWGGMLGAEIAVRQPAGLRSLSICNSPASMQLWTQGTSALRDLLPADVRDALAEGEATQAWTTPEYVAATQVFYDRHVCRVLPSPQDLVDTLAQVDDDPTVYFTMNGPNEFSCIGTLRDWSIVDRLGSVEAPTLVIAGELDEAVATSWQPFVDGIADVESRVFEGASHCTHLEQPEAFRAVVADFLARHDA